jgi:hypothetical protein
MPKRELVVKKQILKILFGLIFILIGAVVVIFLLKVPEIKKFSYPSDKMILFIEKYQPKRMFNEYYMGGYLQWKIKNQKIKVFIDGRAEIFSKNILKDAAVLKAGGNIFNTCSKYDFDLFLVNNNSSVYYYLTREDNWKKVLSDKKNSIFIKKE